MKTYKISVQSLSPLELYMSQQDRCEYFKEMLGVPTNHFTPERVSQLRLLADRRNEEIAAHFWLFSNNN